MGEAIAEAERVMRGWDQRPLFQLTEADAALGAELSGRGYTLKDPTIFMSAPAAALAESELAPVRPVESAAPLAAMEALWALDGVGPERLAVMDRVQGAKTFLALRLVDRIVGVAFVAVDGEIAMLHAVVTAPAHRRAGVGGAGVIAAARFVRRHGAGTLALAVTEANRPARALYAGMGMRDVGGYRYFQVPDRP
jgi:GNAT superfamily N-acetyltransferase